MVNGPDSGPVKLLEEGETWLVEGVFGWDYPEEVRKVIFREHRVSVCVRKLEINVNNKKNNF